MLIPRDKVFLMFKIKCMNLKNQAYQKVRYPQHETEQGRGVQPEQMLPRWLPVKGKEWLAAWRNLFRVSSLLHVLGSGGPTEPDHLSSSMLGQPSRPLFYSQRRSGELRPLQHWKGFLFIQALES